MARYAIHDGAVVLNVIVADSQEIAEHATGLSAVATSGNPWTGWTRHGESWRPPVPSEPGEWVWDEDTGEWVNVAPPEVMS